MSRKQIEEDMELHPVAQKNSFRMSSTEIEAGP